MKKALLFLLSLLAIVSFCACKDTALTELGIPLQELYPEGIRARLPWDMVLWKNKLYVGAGDYDANSGPIEIWCYDIQRGSWNKSAALPEEEINRFCVINGILTAPGIDPKEGWELGNYYQLIDGEWQNVRNLPGGVHNFDMLEYDGMIFCGMGVISGEYPIARSLDGGSTYEQVKMYRDGTPVDTRGGEFVRVYDLFVFDETLYAAFTYGNAKKTYDLYRYENGVFVYDNSWYQKIQRIKNNYKIIYEKVEFRGQLFFSTGYLYTTSNMKDLTKIEFPDNTVVFDLALQGDLLYALCASPASNGKYKISIWKSDGVEAKNFTEIFAFTYDIPPVSFAIDESTFYIGMGDFRADNDKNGTIIKLTTKIPSANYFQ